jgi:hypothetical protein
MSLSPGVLPAAPPEFRALHVERSMALAVCGPLVVAAWTGPVPEEVACRQRVLDEMRRLRRGTHAKLLLYVYLVGENASIPDREARKVSANLPEHFDYCAGVHEGNSMRASLIRAVVTSMVMLSRVRLVKERHVIASTPREAARALAPRSHGRLDEDAIHDAIVETKRLSLG